MPPLESARFTVHPSEELTALVDSLDPVPGPAGRVQRTAGQVGAVLVLLELWLSFGWLGADHWTVRQVGAVTATGTLLASVVQNVAGHLHSRRSERTEQAL